MMPVVGLGLVLVFAGFLLHWIRWRLAPPADSARVLVISWLAGIFGGLLLILLLGWAEPRVAALLPDGPLGIAHAVLLSLALAAAYVMTYPAIEVESPTLVIIQAISRRGAEGLARAALFEQLNDSVLVAPRIQDLLDEKLAVRDGDRIHSTSRGRFLARVFIAWRALLGAPKGG
jgi:hypothetical protein